MESTVHFGLECVLQGPPARLEKSRFGLLMNQASVDIAGNCACDVLAARWPGKLAAISTPQHGLWGEQQANMIESPHGTYEPLGVPVYSLYSETREPTAEMLDQIDLLVVDLQDVGTRVYTFIWTVVNCLQACAARSLPVLILDRPNPLGGEVIEGPLLEEGFESFVGLLRIPMRHGLTIGELALLANHELQIGVDVEVVRMTGWRRRMLFPETHRPWIWPSPNMPRFETAVCYPGQVLLEGTNLSEGRGTTLPFEIVGAPFVNPHALAWELEKHPHPGVRFRPVRFVPMFDKWSGQSCGGVAWHVEDPRRFRSFLTTLSLLAAVRRLYATEFAWLEPPYEYEREKMPIDILYGSSRLRVAIDAGDSGRRTLAELADIDRERWDARVDPFRLY